MNDTPQPLPTFSIIIETVTLSEDYDGGLTGCVTSLANQDYDPGHANEVIVIASDRLSLDEIQAIESQYPWLTVKQIPAHIDVFQAKMAGVPFTTGEVIVLVDADCTYDRAWLHQLLSTIRDHPDIQMLVGETTRLITGPYTLAVALTGVIERFTGEQGLGTTQHFHAGNCAVRREAIDAVPIPHVPGTYRASGGKHIFDLMRNDVTIWRQPLARAFHPTVAPDSFVRRFILQGHDSAVLDRMAISPIGTSRQWGKRWNTLLTRLRRILAEDWRHWLYLIPALPIIGMALTLYLLGRILSSRNPDIVAGWYLDSNITPA